MKIYFAASIRAGRQNASFYQTFVSHLKQHGEVLTEHVGDLTKSTADISDRFIHDRDEKWIQECDLFVADVSTPSLGVGYEIRTAKEYGKKILCLYYTESEKQLSAMIAGCPGVAVFHYQNIQDALQFIDRFIKENF